MLISNAFAAPAAAAPETTLMSFLPMAIIFVLFYFMLIRPHRKQAEEQRNMIAALQKGDEVATSGGVVGKVAKVSDSFVALEVANDVVIHVQKHTIQTLLPKGTIKGL